MSDIQELIHKTSMDCIEKGKRDEQARVIKLLEKQLGRCKEDVIHTPHHYVDCCHCDIIALIKGEQ